MKLYEITGMYLQLMEMMEDPDIDPALIQDSMESLDGDLETKAENIGMMIRNYEATYDAVDAEIKRLQARKKCGGNNISRLKKYLKQSMTVMDKKTLRTAKFTFSVKSGSYSVVVDDQDQVPEQFREPQPDKIIAKDLKAFLEANGDTTYAHLQLGDTTLSIR